MKRSPALLVLIALLTTKGLFASPNIIFILCDDLGYGDLGVTWQNQRETEKKHHTPYLDQMAAEGIWMDRHYCPAPVCAPSRGSFLTGFHQGHCEIRNNQFDKALPADHTVASTLKAGGYRTALVGKYGLQGKGKSAAEWPAYPTKRGFDDFFGYVRHVDGHVHYPAHEWALGNKPKKELWHNEKEISATLNKCFTSDLFTAFAKKWIVDCQKEDPAKPFFLYLAYDTPHAALQYPPCAYPEGGGLQGGVQWLGKPGSMINTAKGEVDAWIHPEHKKKGWTDPEKRQAGMIRRIDDHVGDLMQLLKDLKIEEETLVVFTSDNGPHEESYYKEGKYDASHFQAYGPLNGIKRDVLEGGIRMPALAYWPKTIPAGRIDHNPSQFHDWMTTFLAAAELPLPAQSDGVSLLPTLTGEGQQEEGTVYIEYNNNGRTPDYKDFLSRYRKQKRGEQQVIIMDGYKGIRRNMQDPEEPFQIFNLQNDSREKTNLAGTGPKYAELQKRMQNRVLQLRRPSNTAKRLYDHLPIPGIAARETQPGVEVQFLAGDFPWVPRMPASERQVVKSLGVLALEKGAVQFSGLLEIPAAGDYTFSVEGPAVVLHLHDALVLDTDAPGQQGGDATGSVKLAAGLHPFRMSFLYDEAWPEVALSAKEPLVLSDLLRH